MRSRRALVPRHAPPVAMGDDGLLRFGPAGRVRIAPAGPAFNEAVIADLGRLVDAPERCAALLEGDALGRALCIRRPPTPTDPPNGWAVPDDPSGSGGWGSTLFYDPAEWPYPGDPDSRTSDAVLETLLRHANASAAGRQLAPEISELPAAPPADLRLACRPARAEGGLVFPYSLENLGTSAVYVMDAPSRADAPGENAVVYQNRAGDAVIGRFAAALPTDRQIAVPLVPLARQLLPGETLQGTLRVPAPLAESSPYVPDAPPRCYEAVGIPAVVFALSYWIAGNRPAPRLVAGAPGLFSVRTEDAPGAGRAWQRFPVQGLELFRRTGSFPRPE